MLFLIDKNPWFLQTPYNLTKALLQITLVKGYIIYYQESLPTPIFKIVTILAKGTAKDRGGDLDIAKHVAKAIGRSTPGKLDKVNRMPTVNTVRIKKRKLMSIYTRKTGRIIPQEVYDSMAPVSTPAIFPFLPLPCRP